MKTLLTVLFISLLSCLAARAQQAYLCVYAPLHQPGHLLSDSISFLSDDGVRTQNLLLTSTNYSYFISFYDNSAKVKRQKQALGDSTEPQLVPIEPGDTALYGSNAKMKLVLPILLKSVVDTPMEVWKNMRAKIEYFRYANTLGASKHFYSDTLFPMHWTLVDEEKKFGNLTCKKAVTDFKNQHMVVWYCPDIPIPDGPWKLGGLPGLIVCWEQPEDKALVLVNMQAQQFPHNLLTQLQHVEQSPVPDYPDFLKMVEKRANHAKLYWEQVKGNCVACQTTNGKATTILTLYNPYEGIKYQITL